MPKWGSFTSFMCAGYSLQESRMYSQEYYGGGVGSGGGSGGYIVGYSQHRDPIFNSRTDLCSYL